MKVGIIGAGGIAVTMARTLNQMEDATAYAVASRSLEKAETFAKEHQVENSYDFKRCSCDIRFKSGTL